MAFPNDPVGNACGDNSVKDPQRSVTFYREKDNYFLLSFQQV